MVIVMIVVRFSRKIIENNGGRWCWMLEMELAVVLLLIRKNNIRKKLGQLCHLILTYPRDINDKWVKALGSTHASFENHRINHV